jgi:hypothetical protein
MCNKAYRWRKMPEKDVLSNKKENKIVSARGFEFFLKLILDKKTKKEDSVNFRRRIVVEKD